MTQTLPAVSPFPIPASVLLERRAHAPRIKDVCHAYDEALSGWSEEDEFNAADAMSDFASEIVAWIDGRDDLPPTCTDKVNELRIAISDWVDASLDASTDDERRSSHNLRWTLTELSNLMLPRSVKAVAALHAHG